MGVAGAVVEVEDRDQGGAFVAAQDESVADQIECHIVSISSRIGKGCQLRIGDRIIHIDIPIPNKHKDPIISRMQPDIRDHIPENRESMSYGKIVNPPNLHCVILRPRHYSLFVVEETQGCDQGCMGVGCLYELVPVGGGELGQQQVEERQVLDHHWQSYFYLNKPIFIRHLLYPLYCWIDSKAGLAVMIVNDNFGNKAKMTERSHLLMRPKEELKNQLLMGFRKKKKEEVVDLSGTENVNKVFLTPDQNNLNKSYFGNTSILDQFSRCPIREDEQPYNGEAFLNKFMFTKNRPVFPMPAKTSISVQTEKNQQTVMHSAIVRTKTKPSSVVPNTRTPPRVADFDEKGEKSIVDVSGNLSNYKYPVSDQKNVDQNRILTDSILGHHQKEEKERSDDSAQQLLNQLQDVDESFPIKKTQSQVQHVEKKEPIVKKIQLTRTKSKPEPQSILDWVKENSNQENVVQDDGDAKIDRLLSKKSLLKSMIVKKNQEESSGGEKNLPSSDLEANSKWNKSKKYISEPRIISKTSQKEAEEEQDPTDLLPPYDSSSSGLQAVIEEENESEMEESVKHKPKKAPTVEPRPIVLNEAPLKDQNIQKNSSSKSLRSISLGDLEDVSQIENVSTHKKVPNSFKKITAQKEPSEELPDYEDSENENKPEEKVQMQKYIVKDIAKDIDDLKKRISQDASFQLPQKPKPIEPKVEKKEPAPQRASSGKGSEGPDKKMTSMLDFFDQIHDKLNFGQISKDINDLRDRMANDSQ